MDPLTRLLAAPPDLPVGHHLADVVAAVRTVGAVVVQAPPGTGKTTLVPPALAVALGDAPGGRVVVTQPRRLAARAAARRLASLLGEDLGGTVGYTVRGESRTSRRTRVEVVTTGTLVRRLQRDPELPGVAGVVLDEVHERHLEDDLALALLADVRENLRDDLALVAMSATVEAARTAEALATGSGAVPVVAVEGGLHPVDVVWCPGRGSRTDARGTAPALLDHVVATTRRALGERTGDVLVFVPGAREVDTVAGLLARGLSDVDVRPLHGRLPPREQDRALEPGPRRRVVVSTAVAESSLTVPGVRVVVDAGLAREPRTDVRRGLPGLVTVAVSRAGAEQRAGRAGREGPGAVYRCWSEGDHARLARHPEPEIRTADLTGFALELACWGSPDGAGLALLDPPPAAAWAAARDVLHGLGAVGPDGVTPLGRRIAAVPADPRRARALLDAVPEVGAERAAEVVALLSEDVRVPGADLPAALRALRRGGPGSGAWAAQRDRLERVARAATSEDDAVGGAERGGRRGPADDAAVGHVVALAHPDRLARLRPGGETYLLVSGAGARLPPGSPLQGSPWLAVADVDRTAGRADAVVRSAAPVDEATARAAAASELRSTGVAEWSGGRVRAARVTALGAIELAREPWRDPPAALLVATVRDGLRRDGLESLPWSDGALRLRDRLRFLRRAMGNPWPDVGDDALLDGLDAWLGPDVPAVARGRSTDLAGALRRLLPWPEAARLDALAPERLEVPSGSRVAVDYAQDQPVLAVRLQETFGWASTPRVADGRVPVLLHLLSPAGRPAAVTADLASFWVQGYPQVRAELRGRYPKHAWPQDPGTAQPLRGTPRPRRRDV
ncbi:ATP-dependent helicase HrpB [Cellulosimicrobium cellulans]|uniref:ATP-dependent helicase n=1 Tax=Cellulosimicrobium cellulans TaxID=1710 RepID=A0A4Y4DZU7_CELCE|nr:ATP-dependent helicase HrpB [Cellulosimicrobium cellulans]GED08910.1 ATP-dependent helicase [Cellulosimicrobium cellulans]